MMAGPNPWQWVRYSLGGRLPERLNAWVMHDVTCRTWAWRHVARATVPLTPIIVTCLLVPGPLGIRLAMVGLTVIVGYYFSLSYLEESAEMRVARHGYPYGSAKAAREAAHAETHARSLADAKARYDAAYRAS